MVCHYGQHSFGHYICYRRKPKTGWDKKNLAGDVPVLIGPKLDNDDTDDEDEDSDSRGRSRSRSKGKTTMTNGFADPYSVYSHFSPQPSYCWQDRSETLSGTGKGWLRISDDAVGECGIESVLAQGSGAFMLYYERAVWGGGGMNWKEKERGKTPINGVGGLDNRTNHLDQKGDWDDVNVDGDNDADRFSISSEETLRPKIKVVDLNGSVGSLVSEVGIGIMKQKNGHGKGDHGLGRDIAESPMSMSVNRDLYAPSMSSSLSSSATSSKNFGPRIVRSVNARRGHSHVATNGSAISTSEMVDSLANGTTKHRARDEDQPEEQRDESDIGDIPYDMVASAPSILQVPNLTNNSFSSSTAVDQMGLGSKSTKTMMQHAPTTPGVKAR